MGLNTKYIMGIFGEFTKAGKLPVGLKIYDWLTETAKSNEEILTGLDRLIIYDFINEFVDEMSYQYVLKVDELFNRKGFQFHQANELAWEYIIELIPEKIFTFKPITDEDE